MTCYRLARWSVRCQNVRMGSRIKNKVIGKSTPVGTDKRTTHNASRTVVDIATSSASADECTIVFCLHDTQWIRAPPMNMRHPVIECRPTDESPCDASEYAVIVGRYFDDVAFINDDVIGRYDFISWVTFHHRMSHIHWRSSNTLGITQAKDNCALIRRSGTCCDVNNHTWCIVGCAFVCANRSRFSDYLVSR